MKDRIQLRPIGESRTPSVADLIFDELYSRVVDLTLPPGAKLSEADVARQMGVSRQPVRDAFYRLSQLGFIQIRPQRGTSVAHISEQAVHQARFIRSALEMETVRAAAHTLTPPDLEELDALVDEQARAFAAGDRLQFHQLDDLFHRRICELAGLEFAWTLIRENKGHMDRVRFLSLSFGTQAAIDDHRTILRGLHARDGVAVADAMRDHLMRIVHIIDRIREDHPSLFQETSR